MKDKNWLKEKIDELNLVDTVFEYDGVSYIDTAVSVWQVYDLIDELGEPEVLSQELPVIPKYVCEFIEEVKASGDRLDDAFSILRGIYHQSKTADWIAQEKRNSETFARAWLDGFTIANEDEELWKPIENYEGLYEVSNKGNVRSLDRDVQYKKTDFTMKIAGVDLKPNVLKKGYLQVVLSKNGKRKFMLVHRLVMNAFNPTTDENLQINHIDGNKENNEVSNLEWVTAIENTNHAYDIGLRDDTIGNNRKLTEDEVLEIIDLYETGNYTQKELGNKYSVGRNTIGEILLGKTWGWLTGITREVEEEQKYYIIDKNDEVLWYRDNKGIPKLSGSTLRSVLKSNSKDRYQFTEQEIKDYDERFWAFAVKVE